MVAEEVSSLGVSPGPTLEGGVPFESDLAGVLRANLHLAVASRVLVRLGRFRAKGFPELERKAASLPWRRFMTDVGTSAPRFDVTSRKSRLYHTGAVEERLARVVAASMDVRGESGEPPVHRPRFVVRILRDEVEISVDSSGENLHRRGYREHATRAPLRENLAAAILAVAWDPATPLVDPFCGSGTIPIEAARKALGIPPGRDRAFACEQWPEAKGNPLDWRPAVHRPSVEAPVIHGADRDAGAITAAAANAERGRVADWIAWAQAAISDLRPPHGAPGSVVTNPPYGRRVGSSAELRDLYARFGQVLRSRFGGWNVAVLSADRSLTAHMTLPLEPTLKFQNGGIWVELLTGRVT